MGLPWLRNGTCGPVTDVSAQRKWLSGRSSIVKATSIINRHRIIADPPIAKFLFSDTRMAIAAVAGAFMNMNFMLAGSASSNPVLLILAVVLILAWKTAGYLGLDRFLLPLLGTPWQAPKTETKANHPLVPQLA